MASLSDLDSFEMCGVAPTRGIPNFCVMETKSMANEHSNHLHPAPTAGGPASQPDEHSQSRGFWRSRTALVVAGFAIIAGFLLLSEHRAHALGFLPYLFILACPLLHFFMHGGHGGHGGHGKKPERSNPSNERTQP